MPDFEGANAKLERGRNAVGTLVRGIGRHNVRHIANDEQFARTRIKNDFGGYPRVAAADHHDLRRLPAFGEAPIPILFVTQPANEKGAVSVDQLLGKWHGTPPKGKHKGSHNHAQIAIGNPWRSSGGGSGKRCACPA